MRKEGKKVFFFWVQRGLNGHGKARPKTLAAPTVSSVSAPALIPLYRHTIVHCIKVLILYIVVLVFILLCARVN